MGAIILLNQAFIRTFLSTAFNVPTGFIVPKQGNWFNPQDAEATNFKTDTWCAYGYDGGHPYQMPYMQPTLDGSPPISTSHMRSEIEIQLVGSQAEYMAQSIVHWPHRSDLQALLFPSGMALSGARLGNYVISNFAQDGLNSVLAYNTSIVINWLNEIQTSQTQLNVVNLPTGIVITTPSGTLIVS